MPYTQQTKFNKSVLLFLGALFIIIGSLFVQMPTLLRVAIIVVTLGVFIFLRRGFVYFAQGASFLKMGEDEKAIAKLKASVKAGVGNEQKIAIGTVLIQKNHTSEGIAILKDVLKKGSREDINRAKIGLSMGLWKEGDASGAIDMLESVLDSGYGDNNLYVNLTTYLLADGRVEKAKKIIARADELEIDVPGFVDNKGWYAIMAGRWNKAAEIYDHLINVENAVFPEAYLHGAQVEVHKKEYENAMTYIGWGLTKNYPATCTVSKEYMESLFKGLENPESRKAFAQSMEDNKDLVACGKPFEGLSLIKDYNGPAFVVREQVVRQEEDDEDDRMPDTDLNEDD
ncbi:MAG: tetratricopeptide repeat protein [Spirochaetales bacterium]